MCCWCNVHHVACSSVVFKRTKEVKNCRVLVASQAPNTHKSPSDRVAGSSTVRESTRGQNKTAVSLHHRLPAHTSCVCLLLVSQAPNINQSCYSIIGPLICIINSRVIIIVDCPKGQRRARHPSGGSIRGHTPRTRIPPRTIKPPSLRITESITTAAQTLDHTPNNFVSELGGQQTILV